MKELVSSIKLRQERLSVAIQRRTPQGCIDPTERRAHSNMECFLEI